LVAARVLRFEGRWRWALWLIIGVGLAIRLGAVLSRPHLVAAGDPGEYWGQANLLAQGKGFIEPVVYAGSHHRHVAQTAKLPPLYTMLLALCSLVGFKSFLAHRVWSAILGATAMPLAALVGRDLSGRRAGLIAAAAVAVYPNLWIPDMLGMSETITPVLVLLVLWAAYRMWRQPGWRAAILLGVAIGFAALGRDELLLLAPVVLLPLALGPTEGWRRRPWADWRPRLLRLVAGLLATAAVIAPWVGYNLSRFHDPVFISDRFGATLADANCNASWHGPLAGYWKLTCGDAAVAGVHGDESVQDAAAQRVGLRYLGDHLGGLPRVEWERLGRTFGFYRPFEQINLDVFLEGRPKLWAWVGLGMYYALLPLAVAGAVLLRRRRIIIFPLISVGVVPVAATLVTYGQTRFRVPLEPVLILLAAVTVDALIGRWRSEATATRTGASDGAATPEAHPPGAGGHLQPAG
jgi:4-amino-4-deoxy-L-arabinose transferase-like glycosyltransferase